MNSFSRLRSILCTVAGATLAVLGLGGGIAEGWHEPAARYLAAECRGFDVLATVGGPMTECVAPRSEADGPAATAVVSAVLPATVAGPRPSTFQLPEA